MALKLRTGGSKGAGIIRYGLEKLLPALLGKAEKQQPMTLLEKDFLEEVGMEIDSGEKKSYNG